MIDQSHINLFNYIPGLFKEVGNTGGGELHGPCPFCGGRDRFIVQPNDGNGGHWWCRQCGKSGDAVAFLMEYKALDFKAACEELRCAVPDDKPVHQQRAPQPAVWANDLKDAACFEDAWQSAAEDFTVHCAGLLWDDWKGSAGVYLESRGISRTMAVAAGLGVNPFDYHSTWGSVDVFLPRGITIPWEIDQQLWNVRVRRRNADLAARPDLAKYASAKGCANGMYGISLVRPGQTVYMTEGEFDALVLRQYLLNHQADQSTVVSIGSNSGARVVRWVTRLSLASSVVLVFDNDAAGENAANYWRGALPRKAGWLKPSRKDVTEMWQAGELPLWIGEVG